jgi:hypothetical protein
MPGLFVHVKTKFVEKFYTYLQNQEGWHVEQPISIEFLTEICNYKQEEHSVSFDFSTFSYDDFLCLTCIARRFYHGCNELIMKHFIFSYFDQKITFELYSFFI